MLVCKYVDENRSDAMLAAKKSAGVAAKVNLIDRGTRVPQPPSVNEAAHFGFET